MRVGMATGTAMRMSMTPMMMMMMMMTIGTILAATLSSGAPSSGVFVELWQECLSAHSGHHSFAVMTMMMTTTRRSSNGAFSALRQPWNSCACLHILQKWQRTVQPLRHGIPPTSTATSGTYALAHTTLEVIRSSDSSRACEGCSKSSQVMMWPMSLGSSEQAALLTECRTTAYLLYPTLPQPKPNRKALLQKPEEISYTISSTVQTQHNTPVRSVLCAARLFKPFVIDARCCLGTSSRTRVPASSWTQRSPMGQF